MKPAVARLVACLAPAVLAAVGCGTTPPPAVRVIPREPTPDEVRRAASELPEGFRQAAGGAADEAARLGLRVWAFDFTGGPFGAWVDVEEDGQRTAHSPFARTPESRVGCDAGEGVLLFWLQPRGCPRRSGTGSWGAGPKSRTCSPPWQ